MPNGMLRDRLQLKMTERADMEIYCLGYKAPSYLPQMQSKCFVTLLLKLCLWGREKTEFIRYL